MVIGLIGALVGIGLLVWQVFETRKARVLAVARELYEDRTIRYEGKVTLQNSPFPTLLPGEEVYLSILDGALCLTSRARECCAVDASRITSVASHLEEERAVMQIRYLDETGPQRIIALQTTPARARMIERYCMMGEGAGAQNKAIP